jgi:hypothetical protein
MTRTPAGGFVLIPEGRSAYRRHSEEMAARAARQLELEARLAGMIVKSAAREALLDAGVDRCLLGGALALFLQEVPLVPDGEDDAQTADGLASVSFAARGWLDAQPAYRRRRSEDAAAVGEFTRRLRAVLQ